MVERLHRTMKTALMCHGDESWSDNLPAVLLGLRCHFKEDLGATSAELVYGEPIRLPGEFLSPVAETTNAPEFLRQLREQISQLQPAAPSRHSAQKIFVFKDLENASHVFLRTDSLRAALQPPYTGPHQVLSRSDKTFKLLVNKKEVVVSTDRLKPAYTLSEDTPVRPMPPDTPPPVNIGRIFLEYLWWIIRILSAYRKPKICVYDPSKMSHYYAHTCKPFTKTRIINAFYTVR